jgi:hypothetical protein
VHATDIIERPLRVSFMGGAHVEITIQEIGSLPYELRVQLKYLGDDPRMLRLTSYECKLDDIHYA